MVRMLTCTCVDGAACTFVHAWILRRLGPAYYAVAAKALTFMLGNLKSFYKPGASWNSYAPHVMQADANLTHIKSCDTRDQTDDTFYLIAAWGL